MAAQQSSIFTVSDSLITRLRKMSDAAVTKGLYDLLQWLTPNWKRGSESFEDYLKRTKKDVSMKSFRSALKPSQKENMKKDPHGTTYDVSLLFLLILWGNEFLKDKLDPAWRKDGSCLESFITTVKGKRNELFHGSDQVDAQEFFGQTEAIRNLLKQMLITAGTVCIHVSQAEVSKTLNDVDNLINRIRDDPLNPKDFTAYRNQLMFPQQSDFVKNFGKKELNKRHKSFSSIPPVSNLANFSVPVAEVFIDMILKGGPEQMNKVMIQNILMDENQTTTNIILVEGDAGVGKTTLTKKLLSDWVSGTGYINNLDTFDILLHLECRDQLQTYKELLSSSMAEVSKSFQGEDLKLVTLSLQCLIIVDGFDECNKRTARLFKEILNLKKNHNITVLITTRPEAVERYYLQANSHQIKTKHIQLVGIPHQRRDEFVRKYYSKIEEKGLSKQGIDGLLEYLRRTEGHLSYLWRLPYNLTLITILWTNYPDVINSITTAPELHWEIHQMYLSKLLERLQNCVSTQHLPLATLKWKISLFIFSLSWESLVALKDNDVTLTVEAYQRLENTCNEIEIPAEEMIGAFLKKTTTSMGTRYSFPHKGTQDFLGAHCIWIQLTGMPLSYDVKKITKGFLDILSQNSVPTPVSKNILMLTEGELGMKGSHTAVNSVKTKSVDMQKVLNDIESLLVSNNVPEHLSRDISSTVRERLTRFTHDIKASSSAVSTNTIKNILKKVHDGSSDIEMTKFQNTFIFLIGMFYLDNNKINESIKSEVLDLLQRTGVKDRNAWLEILSNVKCDEYVASFVSKQPGILKGQVQITDSSLFAYISLLQALKNPCEITRGVNITISMKRDTQDVTMLLTLIQESSFSVKVLKFNNDFKQPKVTTGSSDQVICEILHRCGVEEYTGAITPTMKLPRTIASLSVSLSSAECFAPLQAFFQLKPDLFGLSVCVSPTIDAFHLRSLPGLEFLSLYIPDVEKEDIIKIQAIILGLHPCEGKKQYYRIFFPRSKLSPSDTRDLLDWMVGVRVYDSVVLPSYLKPSSPRDVQELRELAEQRLHCCMGIIWEDESEMWPQ